MCMCVCTVHVQVHVQVQVQVQGDALSFALLFASVLSYGLVHFVGTA